MLIGRDGPCHVAINRTEEFPPCRRDMSPGSVCRPMCTMLASSNDRVGSTFVVAWGQGISAHIVGIVFLVRCHDTRIHQHTTTKLPGNGMPTKAIDPGGATNRRRQDRDPEKDRKRGPSSQLEQHSMPRSGKSSRRQWHGFDPYPRRCDPHRSIATHNNPMIAASDHQFQAA
jgi:hypothetical protein